MLKPVIQHMNLRTQSRLGESPGLIAIFTHDHRPLQPPCNQQRLVAEIPRKPAGLYQQHTASAAPITAREHIEAYATRLQQLAQQNSERSLSRTSDREISHADHGSSQQARAQPAAVVEHVAYPDHAAIHR